MTRSIGIVLASMAIAACSDSSGPTAASVAGTWTVTANSLSGNGYNCSLSAMVQLMQRGSVLSGNLPGSGIVFTCHKTDVLVGPDTIAGTGMVTGSVNGNSIVMLLAANTVVADGTVFGTSMSGNSMTLALTSPAAIVATGPWSATRN